MVCEKCQKEFSKIIKIKDKFINLQRRKWCLECSPFGTNRKGIISKSLILSNINICKNCGKEFTEKYSKWSNGDFCCKNCAHSYTGKQFKGTKLVHCITCQKEIEVDKRASSKQYKCDDCKKERKKYKYKNNILVEKICKICGESECLRKDICQKFRLFPSLIKYFGFDEKKIGTLQVYEEFDRIKNMLIEDYYDKQFSIVDLIKKYNHDDLRNFNKILNSLNIIKRKSSESIINSILKGKGQKEGNYYSKYKHGYHLTWNNKQVFYRSSYELDYAKELDEKKINYEMEKLRVLYWDTQLLKQRIAIPDFYLPETNEIVEIKSTWTYDEINIKDKFKAYKEHGYKVKLILEHIEILK